MSDTSEPPIVPYAISRDLYYTLSPDSGEIIFTDVNGNEVDLTKRDRREIRRLWRRATGVT